MESSSPIPAPALRSFRLRAAQAGPHPVLGGLVLVLALAGGYGLATAVWSGELSSRLVALANPPAASSPASPAVRAPRVPLDPPLVSEAAAAAPAESGPAPRTGAPEPGARLAIGPEAAALRAQPSPSSPLVAMLASGTIVEALPDDAEGGEQGWHRVRWNGQEGWVATPLLQPLP
jgi:hypothetical protein